VLLGDHEMMELLLLHLRKVVSREGSFGIVAVGVGGKKRLERPRLLHPFALFLVQCKIHYKSSTAHCIQYTVYILTKPGVNDLPLIFLPPRAGVRPRKKDGQMKRKLV